jgi:hypothetical protein
MKLSLFYYAANEAAANEAVVAGSFTITQPDGFEIAYGEYGHPVGVQVFDREAAQSMANELASLLGKITRGFRGVPVYAGHPDHPDQRMAAQYPDRKARGWIKEIIVGETSARFVTAYNELGKGEVEDAQWAGYSPLWLMQPVANQRGKFRPMILKSMALTNNPNMPVPPLIVANETDGTLTPAATNQDPMKPELKAKLMKLLGLADDADETAFDEAVNGYFDKMLADKDKPAPAAPDPKPEDEEKKKAEEAAAAANVATAAANEAVRNLRNTRIDFALEQLVNSGRVTPANVPAEKAKLVACANEADLSTAIDKLRAVKPTLQTNLTHAANIAAQKGELLAANDASVSARQRQEAVDAIMKERPGISQSIAWGMAASRNPKLFT